jgi:hypothetical protein
MASCAFYIDARKILPRKSGNGSTTVNDRAHVTAKSCQRRAVRKLSVDDFPSPEPEESKFPPVANEPAPRLTPGGQDSRHVPSDKAGDTGNSNGLLSSLGQINRPRV